MGRPKTYENAAERQAAFRSKNSRLDIVVSKDIDQTLSDISTKLDVSKNALVNSMLRYALTNHNWNSSLGYWQSKK